MLHLLQFTKQDILLPMKDFLLVQVICNFGDDFSRTKKLKAIFGFLGCFVTGLEYSADVKAEVIGKPEGTFFKSALERLNSQTEHNLGYTGIKY
jgi:ribonucleotide monophosphatase NagD (HAD superfamily)